MQPPASTASVRRGSNLPRVGDYNQVVVLEAIRSHAGGLSRVELSVMTGLSAQTVSNICRRLLDAGLVVEAGKASGGQGKPRTLLRLVPQGRYAVGLHLDPVVATVVVLDLLGHVVARSDHPLHQGAEADQVIAGLADDVDALVEASGVDRTRIAGLGVAVPGPVDSAQGAVVSPPNLPGWGRVPVRDLLAARTGLPVLLDKDVVAVAVAELWAGGVGGTGSAVFVYLGTGVGTGVVLGGEVLRGSSGNAGEVGHLLTGPSGTGASAGLVCACGMRSCLGQVCSPTSVVEEAERRGVIAPSTDVDAGPAAFAEVCARADAGDPEALSLLEERARQTARAVCGLVDLLDVEQVVFGGPLWSGLERVFLRVVPPIVAATTVAAAVHPVQVRGSRLGADVAAVGAGCLVLERAFSPRSATLLLQH